MAKGSQAKENLIARIVENLPDGTYIGCYDKKHYFWSQEDGEKIQVCMSLTCPKTPIETENMEDSEDGVIISDSPKFTEEEQMRIQNLFESCGL